MVKNLALLDWDFTHPSQVSEHTFLAALAIIPGDTDFRTVAGQTAS